MLYRRMVAGCILLMLNGLVCGAPVEIGFWLDRENHLVLPITGTHTINASSAGGYLIPIPNDEALGHPDPKPFDLLLSNDEALISMTSLGRRVVMNDESWTTQIRYDLERALAGGVDLREDLSVSAGSPADGDCLAPPPGDANLDCSVDFADFLILAENFRRDQIATWREGDFDWDRSVQFTDFLILASSYNATVNGAVVAIPEPNSLVFVAIACLSLTKFARTSD